MTDIERRMQLQAIYEEIEKSPVNEKVRKYFKEKPYQLRRGKEVNNGEKEYIHAKEGKESRAFTSGSLADERDCSQTCTGNGKRSN